MASQSGSSVEAIIADTLGRPADLEISAETLQGTRLSRWRQFVGSYVLPALPQPVFVVHIGGKPTVRYWNRDGWSETTSAPGAVTLVPAGMATRWLVDGELDVATLSMSPSVLPPAASQHALSRLRFAFADPLGNALARQIISVGYKDNAVENEPYLASLLTTFAMHAVRCGTFSPLGDIPATNYAAHRIHSVIDRIIKNPGIPLSVDEMAHQAGVTGPHFCRIFKKATGQSPHQYLQRARLERARELLSTTQLPLSTIAESLGFGSQSHFTRAFRSFNGFPPSDLRHQHADSNS